jgi:hypothetical protein
VETQISALVSSSTRDLLDRHARKTGIKKSRLVEDAIRHHLSALSELPNEFMTPTRMVVSAENFERLVRRTRAERPNAALKTLLRR